MAPKHVTHKLNAPSRISEKHLFQFLRYSHLFASVMREILEVQFLEEVTPHSLTLQQFHMLKLIALNGVHQIGEVAFFLGMSPPAATNNIDKLHRLGLVLRNPSKGDRRATLVSPSAKGRRVVQGYETLIAEHISQVLGKFRAQEIERLIRLLRRLSLSIIRLEDTGEGPCLWCAAYCEENCLVARIRGGCPYAELRGAA